ncbi:RseA family anti-sigma factor [Aliikangiella sp. IMCC44632]
MSNEHISELLDDCVSAESIEKLLNSTQDQESWYRYNLVRSAINNETTRYSSIEFTQSISAIIQDEPAIIAVPKVADGEAPKIEIHKKSNVTFLKRFGGGLAVAATVAYATVFSVQMMTPSIPAEDVALQSVDNNSASVSQNNVTQLALTTEQPSANLLNVAREQADLDYLQAIIDNVNRNNMQANEEYVGGEAVFSWKVKANQLDELQKQVSDMKKPLKEASN